MKYLLLITAILFSIYLQAQIPVVLPQTAKGIVVDSRDNVIVTVFARNSIMKISPDGKISYVTEDIRKGFNQPPYPGGDIMTIDAKDNIYLIAGAYIWKVSPDGKVNLFAGNPYRSKSLDGLDEPKNITQFSHIEFIEADPKGNIYIAEDVEGTTDNPIGYYVIRKISTDGMVSTLLNTRENAAFKTNIISGMGVDSVGNIYLSDAGGRCIKKLAPDGKLTTVAGLCNKRRFQPFYITGDISKAELMAPEDILVNKKGEIIFTDGRLHRIIKIANNKVTTIAGNSVIQPNSHNAHGRAKEGYQDGKALTALFNFPLGCNMAIDSKQNIYVIDGGNDCIRKLPADGIVTTFAIRKRN